MLTIAEALRIAIESLGEVADLENERFAALDRSDLDRPEEFLVRLEEFGLTTPQQIHHLVGALGRRVRDLGYEIDPLLLQSVGRDMMTLDLARSLTAYSLPGTEPFEEPAGEPVEELEIVELKQADLTNTIEFSETAGNEE
jgi:hypothetical protein